MMCAIVKTKAHKIKMKTVKPKQTERIQKILAQAGLGSRREIERWIDAGRITVDGKVAKLGDSITQTAKVCVDGHPMKIRPSNLTRVILYHKPAREICTRSDPEGRPTVFAKLPQLANSRWVMVGRLDFNTSGLLLFTNNGELANRLMHPSQQIEREYAVRALGQLSHESKARLLKGVELEDGFAKLEAIEDAGGEGSNTWYHVVLKEGRNREVRRLFEIQGLTVSRLIRIRFGILSLPRFLARGRWEELDSSAVQKLCRSVGITA